MSWRRIDYIVRMLEEGPLSTREIYDEFLDNYPKKCPTMYELGMMLSRSKMVMKHRPSTNERTSFRNRVYGSKWTGHTIWKINEEAEGLV